MEAIGVNQCGFTLPKNHTWDAKLKNGKKEGKVIVKDEDGRVFRVLQFKNDQLNGLCEFYNHGRLVEKRMFLNDKEEGWSCEVIRGRETKWFLYSNGSRVAELKKCDDMVDYWKAIDLSSNTVLSICKYDENHKATDKGYLYVDKTIDKVVLFKNGIESVLLKRFDGKRMIEFDNNGNQVYKGGYADSIANDYPREGDGIEYDEGKIVYEGGFVNGKREGEGCSYKDGLAYYEGEWKEGQPDGEGWLSVNGEVYEGKWVKGVFSLGMNHWYDYFGGRVIKRVIKNENELRELLKNADEKKRVSELVIEEECGNDMKDDLELCGFDNLRVLVLKKKSLMNLKSLKISDNSRLEKIEAEDNYDKNKFGTGVCENVKSVIIESIND